MQRPALLLSTALLSTLAAAAAAPAAEEQSRLLPELVVSASLVETAFDTVGSSMTVIDRRDLDNRQARLVSDVLREVPGLAVTRTGGPGTQTRLHIRGAEGNHTLVVIDGIEANDPAGGSEFDFGQLLAEDIERIEVVRGAQSALWGSDAIGGVVNITTRRGEGPLSMRLGLEAGSRNTTQTSGNLSGGGEGYHYAFSLNRFRTDGISAASRRNGNTEEDAFLNKSAAAKFGFSPLGILSFDFAGRIERAEAETDGFAGGTGAVDDASSYAYTRRYGRGQATLKLFDGAWEHRLGAAITDTDNTSFDGFGGAFANEGRKRKLDYRTSLFFDTPILAQAEHTLTLAAEAEKERLTSAFALGGEIGNDGYVAEYRVNAFSRLSVSAAFRFDDNERFDDAATYRLTASYSLPEWGTRFKASHGTGVKNPTLFELFGFTTGFVGNPNLRPEHGRSFDAGVEQRFWDGRAVLDVTGFANRIDDLIGLVGFPGTSVNLPGTSKIEGIELALHMQATEGLRLGASYTFSDGEDAAGRALVRRPRHIASANAAWRFAGGRGSLNLGLKYNGSSIDTRFDASFTPSPVRLDGYWLVDLAASYALTDQVEVFGRIENLLNHDYQEAFTYGSVGFGAFAGLRMRY